MPKEKIECININMEIKDLPLETNRMLNVLAKISGSPKTVVIRAALMEYVTNHRNDIMKFAGVMQEAIENTEQGG